MSSPTDTPLLPRERWWGDHVRELRWQLERYRLLIDPVFRGAGVPRGDGRPVVLPPGFGGGDHTLIVLASWLRRIGYRPHLGGFVANLGCSDRAVERIERRLEDVHARHGRRVALLGHSRGGHYARALGRRRPELVSHAISIGAALRQMLAVSEVTRAAAVATREVVLRSGRARSQHCMTEACDCAFGRDWAGQFPSESVRLTSIYSKGDGVVRWQAALVPYATCVEVRGSHVGLIFNRKTYRAIAAALAEPERTNEEQPC
jgi:triacylglycerol lipase